MPFTKLGPAFIGCENQPKLLEVSADGILRCSSGGETCPNYSIHGDRRIVIEIKSPTPQDNVAKTLFYKFQIGISLNCNLNLKLITVQSYGYCTPPQLAQQLSLYYSTNTFGTESGISRVHCMNPTIQIFQHDYMRM